MLASAFGDFPRRLNSHQLSQLRIVDRQRVKLRNEILHFLIVEIETSLV